jgi:intracellular sulfur oxidation DsrE/DsrF family protein
MKSSFLTILSLFMAPTIMLAQMKDYKVVFDLTSKDTAAHRTVLRYIDLITKEAPDAQLEVVFYGQSLDMVRNDKSTMTSDVSNAVKKGGVSFVVCEAAMRRHNITKDQLLTGIKTVPDGIYELITKQRQGWGYIKVVPQ